MSEPASRRWPGLLARGLGFVICLGLLGWAGREALSPENREQLIRLREAPVWAVVSLFALSLASVVLGGAAFWASLTPVRRISFRDVQAVNAIAMLLAYSMKLGAIARVLLHARRDGVPLFLMGAWFLAVLTSIFAATGPMAGAALLSPRLGDAWWVVGLVGVVLTYAAIVGLAIPFRGENGLARLHRLLDPLAVGPLRKALRSARFAQLHSAMTMLACPRTMAIVGVLRTTDVVTQASRFGLSAWVVEYRTTPAEAVAISSGAFAIQILSPFGVLGAREAGTIAIADALGAQGADPGRAAIVALLVVASEALVLLGAVGLGAVWLLRNPRTADRPSPEAKEPVSV